MERFDILKLCRGSRAGEIRDNKTDWNLHTIEARMVSYSIRELTMLLIDKIEPRRPFASRDEWQKAMSRGPANK